MLKQIFANNNKLTNSNDALTATNKQPVGEVKDLSEQANLFKKMGGEGRSRGLEKGGSCSSHGYKVSKGQNNKMCNCRSTAHNEAATRSNPMGGSTANKGWDI